MVLCCVLRVDGFALVWFVFMEEKIVGGGRGRWFCSRCELNSLVASASEEPVTYFG